MEKTMDTLKNIGLQFFADPAHDETPSETPGNIGDGDGGQQQPEKVDLTQEQLDDLIKKAFAKGARKAAKDADKPASGGKDDASDDQIAAANVAMQKAQRMCENAALLTAATAAGFIDPRDALAFVDRSGLEVDDDGNVEGADDAIKALSKAKPHLVRQAESMPSPPPIAPRNPAPSGMQGSSASVLDNLRRFQITK